MVFKHQKVSFDEDMINDENPTVIEFVQVSVNLNASFKKSYFLAFFYFFEFFEDCSG